MMVTRLRKSGHSVVLALPTIMRSRLWLEVGDYVKLEDVVEGILVKPLEPRAGAKVAAGKNSAKGKVKP